MCLNLNNRLIRSDVNVTYVQQNILDLFSLATHRPSIFAHRHWLCCGAACLHCISSHDLVFEKTQLGVLADLLGALDLIRTNVLDLSGLHITICSTFLSIVLLRHMKGCAASSQTGSLLLVLSRYNYRSSRSSTKCPLDPSYCWQ